jgi:hypothetical protein
MADQIATSQNIRIPNIGLSYSPAPAVFQDKLYVIHQGSGENGQIWYVTSRDGVNWASDRATVRR